MSKKVVSKIRGLVTRGRAFASGSVLLVTLAAYFGLPYGKDFVGAWTNPDYSAQPENSPVETLSAMTDTDLRDFAVRDKLPVYLSTNDWTRARIVREALREHLGQELVKRWDRDANSVASAPFTQTATNQLLSSVPQNESNGRGVLGVQIGNNGYGLSVTQVYPNSAAARAGLRVGDQILSVNQRRVTSQAELVAQLHAAANDNVYAQLEVLRQGTRRIVSADVTGRSANIANRGFLRF